MIDVKRTYDKDDRLVEAEGKCRCGYVIDFMERDCYDTIECPKCGKLYNSSGQTLLPRYQWEEQMDDDY